MSNSRIPILVTALVTALLLTACPGAQQKQCLPLRPCPGGEQPASAPAASAAAEPAGAAAGAKPTQTMVLQGTPPIPAALRARLNQYMEMRSAALNKLDDQGRAMLVTTRFAQTYQAHLVRAPLGARQQITFNREPVSNVSFVPGRNDALLYMADIGGNEQYQIVRLDLADRRTTLLTDGKSRHGGYAWSHDGKRIAYTSNARNGKDMDIYVGDGRRAAAGRLLLERSGHWMPLDWSRDGKQLLIAHYLSINDSRLWVVDVAAKKATRLTPEKPGASYRSARFDATGRKVFVATDREGEFVELYEVDLAKKSWRPLTRDLRWNVDGLALSPDGRTLVFSTNEDGYGVVHLLDTRTRKHRKLAGIPRGMVSGLTFARKAPVLGLTLYGPDRSADAFTYDLRRRKLVRWTRSEIGGLDPARFIAPQLIHYETFDKRKIPAYYYKPRGAGPHPVIVWIHGGPEGQARPYFSPLLQYLVSAERLRRAGAQRARLRRLRQVATCCWTTAFGARTRSRTSARCWTGWTSRSELDARPRGGLRRLLRRLHGAGLAGPLRPPDRGRGGHRGDQQLRHLLAQHQGLPPRPAPGRVRRRARPEDARPPAEDLAVQQR